MLCAYSARACVRARVRPRACVRRCVCACAHAGLVWFSGASVCLACVAFPCRLAWPACTWRLHGPPLPLHCPLAHRDRPPPLPLARPARSLSSLSLSALCRISEEEFWRNYFSHVFAVKRRFELGQQHMEAPPTAPTVGGPGHAGPSSYPAMDVETPATPGGAQQPGSPGGRMGLTVSYPEKFQLALKYAAEGPPLPNLSDADRILLEALQQQATVGECNRPRPGMWDSAEEKAKYEAWRKLGSMPRSEAMHLYVQAIEVFDEHWLEWKGLQAALAAAVGAVTPVNGAGGSNGAGGKLDVAHTVSSMRALRASLSRLPPTQQQTVRDECTALQRALDTLRVPPATR